LPPLTATALTGAFRAGRNADHLLGIRINQHRNQIIDQPGNVTFS
jgi:hypothetical protein